MSRRGFGYHTTPVLHDRRLYLQLIHSGGAWVVTELEPKERYNRTLRFVASPVIVAELIVIPSAKGRGVVRLKPSANGIRISLSNSFHDTL